LGIIIELSKILLRAVEQEVEVKKPWNLQTWTEKITQNQKEIATDYIKIGYG
jgi:hypothetical protein